jgi:hypothetical protein
VLPIETARGCVFTCKFCAWEMIGKKKGSYERDLNLLRNELTENYEKYGVTHYQIMDDTFNDSDEKINNWCDMLETLPFKIYYSGFMRLDLCHRFQATTRRLYQTGLRGANFGIESFHPEASRAIGKAFNGKQAKEFIPYLWENIFNQDVMMFATMIVGLPGETKKDVYDHYKFVKSADYMNFRYAALRLPEDHHFKSEFDKNLPKYGYEKIPGAPGNWKSQWMDRETALKIATDLNNDIDQTFSCDSWTYLYYHAFGANLKDVLQSSWNNLYEKYKHNFAQQNRWYFDAVYKGKMQDRLS